MRTQDNAHIGMNPTTHRTDTGSMTVELVVLTPVLFLLALMMLVFGRVSAAQQQVTESARAGAQAAAVQPTKAAAQYAAVLSAVYGYTDRAHLCPDAQISTNVGNFVAGGSVSVTVVCHVALSDLSIPGVPGTTTVQATASAPIDPYRSVG
jgi:Flp pilus assembly protein TadG